MHVVRTPKDLWALYKNALHILTSFSMTLTGEASYMFVVIHSSRLISYIGKIIAYMDILNQALST